MKIVRTWVLVPSSISLKEMQWLTSIGVEHEIKHEHVQFEWKYTMVDVPTQCIVKLKSYTDEQAGLLVLRYGDNVVKTSEFITHYDILTNT